MFGYGYGGIIQQEYEQESIGYGPQGFGVYEQEVDIDRNPYTGATVVVQENEFIPTGGFGYMGYSGYGVGYGYEYL